MATTPGDGAGGHLQAALPQSPRGKTEMDDGSGSYGAPATAFQFSDHHKPHSPHEAPHAATHLPTGSAVNEHAQPLSLSDDGTGSYGQPPSVYVGIDDTHKAHRP